MKTFELSRLNLSAECGKILLHKISEYRNTQPDVLKLAGKEKGTQLLYPLLYMGDCVMDITIVTHYSPNSCVCYARCVVNIIQSTHTQSL